VGGLIHSFVSQSSRTRHYTNLSFLMDIARHNSDFAFSRLDNSRAVGANQTGFALGAHHLLNANHVESGNSLSDAHHQGDFTGYGFFNGSSSAEGRYVDNRCFGVGFFHACFQSAV